jgi:hypothetical protein
VPGELSPAFIGLLEAECVAGVKGGREPTTLSIAHSGPVLMVSVTACYPGVENDVAGPDVETRELLKVIIRRGSADCRNTADSRRRS